VTRIATEAIRLFDHGSVDAMKSIDDDRMQILIKILERQLQEIETALPVALRGDGMSRADHDSRFTDCHSDSLEAVIGGEDMHQ
jgi:hypothetical protein